MRYGGHRGGGTCRSRLRRLGHGRSADDRAASRLGYRTHIDAADLRRAADQVLRWDVESAAKTVGAAGTPLLYIEGPGGLADLDALRERCPHLAVGKTVGVGHDQMLETPIQTVSMISAFLAATLDRQRSV